jgi:hypothetical protein
MCDSLPLGGCREGFSKAIYSVKPLPAIAAAAASIPLVDI